MHYKWLFPTVVFRYIILKGKIVLFRLSVVFEKWKNSMQIMLLLSKVGNRKEKHSSISNPINTKSICFETALGFI